MYMLGNRSPDGSTNTDPFWIHRSGGIDISRPSTRADIPVRPHSQPVGFRDYLQNRLKFK